MKRVGKTKKNLSELEKTNIEPNDLTEIIFTSGTTGEPKGVMHTYNTVITSALYWLEHLKLTTNDVILMASTIAHQTGFLYGVLLPILYKGRGVYQDIWDPKEFIKLKGKSYLYSSGYSFFARYDTGERNRWI